MSLTNAYLKRVFDGLEQRNPNEKEFLQAVEEVLDSAFRGSMTTEKYRSTEVTAYSSIPQSDLTRAV